MCTFIRERWCCYACSCFALFIQGLLDIPLIRNRSANCAIISRSPGNLCIPSVNLSVQGRHQMKNVCPSSFCISFAVGGAPSIETEEDYGCGVSAHIITHTHTGQSGFVYFVGPHPFIAETGCVLHYPSLRSTHHACTCAHCCRCLCRGQDCRLGVLLASSAGE